MKRTLIIIVAVLSAMTVGGSVVRNSMLWEMTIEDMVDARIALEDNLMLLEAGLEYNRTLGLSEGYTTLLAERIVELKLVVDTMYVETLELMNLPFYDKLLFIKKDAETAYTLSLYWGRIRTESIVGITQNLRESQVNQ